MPALGTVNSPGGGMTTAEKAMSFVTISAETELTAETLHSAITGTNLHVPKAHADTHEDTGADEISVTGLSGLLATAQTPAAHKDSHASDGSDPVKSPTAYNVCKLGPAYNSVVQGTWIFYIDLNCYLAGEIYNSSNAVNDEISYKLSHKKGSYTFCLLCPHGDNGIVSVYLDGVLQGTIDQYGTDRNHIDTLAISFTSDGEHTLNLKCASKNASATTYIILIGAWWIKD